MYSSRYITVVSIIGVLCLASLMDTVMTDIPDGKHMADSSEHHDDQDHGDSMPDIPDTTQETVLKEESHMQLASLFDRIDLNRNGTVEHDELKKWVIKTLKSSNILEAREKLNHVDTNKDKRISWSEILFYGHEITEEKLKEMESSKKWPTKDTEKEIKMDKLKFNLADLNKDQYLNDLEYTAYLYPQNFERMLGHEIEFAMEGYDTNKDGKLSLNEYLADLLQQNQMIIDAEKRQFQEYDTNKDGFLDTTEMKKWLAPGYDNHAKSEVDYLFEETDKNKDGVLTKDEVIEKHEYWNSSAVTNYGNLDGKDEL